MIRGNRCTATIGHFGDSSIARKTGGEGGIRTREAGISRLHTFQACSFNRSDTSPHQQNLSPFTRRAGWLSPSWASPLALLGASLRLSKFVPDEFVEPAKRV